MATKSKTLTKSRVSRFEQTWSPEHQANTLADIGMTFAQFQKLGAADRKSAVDRALSAGQTLDSPTGLTTVPTPRQAQQQAVSQANAQYAPQQAAIAQAQANVDPWFQDFANRLQGYQTGAASYAAPIVAGSQAFTAQTAAAPAGLDPNSAAGQKAIQAAQGRQSIAQLGTDALNANAAATNTYFAGLGAAAAAQQPGVKAGLANSQASLDAQKAQAVGTLMDNARTQAQNYSIANATLGNTIANDQANTAVKAQDAATAKSKADTAAAAAKSKAATAATTPNAYGVPADQWARWSTSHRQRVIAQAKANTPAAKKQAAQHETAITKTVGKTENTVTDIQTALQVPKGATKKVSQPVVLNGVVVPGQFTTKTVPLTPADQQAAATKKYGATMVQIAQRVQNGQPLTPTQVAYLHNSDPNLRIPTAWLRGRATSPAPAKPHPSVTQNPLTGENNPLVN